MPMTMSLPAGSCRMLLLAAFLLAAPAAPGAAEAQRADSAALVTRLGRDTLALERWVRRGDRVEAVAVVRSPRTTLRRYLLELAPDGTMRRFEERVFDPAGSESPVRTETLVRTDSGWTRTLAQGDSVRTAHAAGGADALPFVDLVHWPMELVTTRAVGRGIETQPLFTGARTSDFRIAREGDQVTITHPFRGPSVARVDAAGRLLSLDASETTRKVMVTRVPWLQLEETARRWAAADRAGRGVGELSGRAGEDVSIGSARLQLDYGTPSKRGREIFGNIVPWGEVWRTGANRATHFSTDRPLVLGDPATGTLAVPAGEYTLFSIPEENGGVLIVNRQTGQNGTAYDPAQDLGRVRMRRTTLPETVERFTIRVEPRGADRGELQLLWDRTGLVVPVVVR